MTIHAFILALTIATLLGSVYHFIRGGTLRRLGVYLLTANTSFLLGHFVSDRIHWETLRLGALNLFPAALAALLGLVLANILLGEEDPPKPKPGGGSRHRR